LSKKDKIDLKNANIGIAVGAFVLALRFVPFQDGEGATVVLTVGAFVAGLGTMFLLDWRDERVRRRDDRRSP
jgi:hypothetical protein